MISATLSLFFFTCKNGGVTPPDNSATDTTSQIFAVIRIDTLGDVFSFANGVDIVDDDNIWVAGIFTERDSSNQTVYNKNLAHWNGTAWEKQGVMIYGYNNSGPTPQELVVVKSFEDSAIFVVSKYNSHARWDGHQWTSYFVDSKIAYIEHLWSRGFNDIYFSGSHGSISSWNGSSFNKIDLGLTNTPFTDIWGDERSVYAVGYSGSEVVFATGNSTAWRIAVRYELQNPNVGSSTFVGTAQSVFRGSEASKLWVLGGWGTWTVYEISHLDPFTARKLYEFPYNFPALLIRGTGDNDLYVSSQLNGTFFHFNGNSWIRFDTPLSGFHVFDFAVKGNTWAAVGAGSSGGVGTAMIVIGRHM